MKDKIELYGRFGIPLLSKDGSILDYHATNRDTKYKEVYSHMCSPSIWLTDFKLLRKDLITFKSPLNTKLGKALYKD
ncbi:MAG: hypothetical protein HC836_45125 [Richelia sp. RM2_1_2]|nr:hypothetical protein [Richelia sp. RM2_1_2]